jgi:hypothetical protein
VCDRDGLTTLEARFQHAALIVLTALVAVFVAQVDFHTRYVIGESSEGALHDASHLTCKQFMAFDIVIRTDLDLHGTLLAGVLDLRTGVAHET